MNSHTVCEAKNRNPIYSKTKSDENIPNISEMENNGLQDGVIIDVMLPASTLNKKPIWNTLKIFITP